jgi:glucose-1-phosphate adenylyltransferase
MDYSRMVERHKESGAAGTISVMEIPWSEAPRFGIMDVDEHDIVREFQEKPEQPKSNLASMGIYVFTWKTLRAYLEADEADSGSENDFGKNVIPAMLNNGEKLAAYRFEGYWKDVGTLESLWDANMDMLSPESGLDLLDDSWPIYAKSVSMPTAYLGRHAQVNHSAFNRGGNLEGTIENSVLSAGVNVEEGARVSYSVLMPGVTVKAGAVVEYAIVGQDTLIGENCRVGAPPENADSLEWGLTVLAPDCELAAGTTVPPKTMLNKSGGEVSR